METQLKNPEDVRNLIRSAPSFKKLFAAHKRFCRRLRPHGNDSWFTSYTLREFEPERLLKDHAGVMNAKSAAAKTMMRLANAVFAETQLPRKPQGKFRGEDGLDWEKLGFGYQDPMKAPKDWKGEK